MKNTHEDQRGHGKPVWLWRAVTAHRAGTLGPLAAVLMVAGAGCHEPRAEISSTAAGLRTSVTKQVQAPAPQSLGVLTVDRAIAEALAASPQLDQMADRVAAAREQVKLAEAAFYPRLVLASDYSRTDNPVYAFMAILNQRRVTPSTNFNDPGEQSNLSTQLQAQWTVFDGGRSYYNRQAAGSQELGAKAALAAERNQLVATVSQVYYQWLQARTFIGVAQQALGSARTNEQMAQVRVENQVSLESDLLRLKAARAEAEGQLLSAESSASKLQAALERLLVRHIASQEIPTTDLKGFPNAEERAGGPNPDQPQNAPADPTSVVDQALAQRPEIEAAAAMIAAAADQVEAAKGAFLPNVFVHGQLQWDSEDLSNAENSWLVGVSAAWPLFEGGATHARLRQARANLREMQARGKQRALDIALDVYQAALTAQEAQQRVEIARRQLDFARQSHQDVRTQFQNQTATVEGLLQAEVAWQRAEAGYAAAPYEAKVAQAMLRRALGQFASE
ncbi:MAG: TolC family protein [Planctomycetes bacterium]|nr:TolC family protein [Planctomycetota bacterium]